MRRVRALPPHEPLLTGRPETPVPSPYRALFAAPGSKGFAAAGFVGRMPLSMMGIGVVTMISQLTGRYGLAGMLSATIALAAAAIGPQGSPLGGLHRQRRGGGPAAPPPPGGAPPGRGPPPPP